MCYLAKWPSQQTSSARLCCRRRKQLDLLAQLQRSLCLGHLLSQACTVDEAEGHLRQVCTHCCPASHPLCISLPAPDPAAWLLQGLFACAPSARKPISHRPCWLPLPWRLLATLAPGAVRRRVRPKQVHVYPAIPPRPLRSTSSSWWRSWLVACCCCGQPHGSLSSRCV